MTKFEMPKEFIEKTYKTLSSAKDSGKIKKGANETTKAIERNQAIFVIMAEDVSPPEIIAHVPIICDEKDIPYVYVPKKEELGRAAGLSVPTSSVAIIDAGEAKKQLTEIISRIKELKTGKKPLEEKEKTEQEKPPESEKVEHEAKKAEGAKTQEKTKEKQDKEEESQKETEKTKEKSEK